LKTEKHRPEEIEYNLIDYLTFLLKWKRLIVSIILSCVVFTIITGLLMPKTYRAETRILPPQQNNAGLAAQLLNQVGGSITGISGILDTNNQKELYVGMLQSRTILDNIITKFDLKTLYHVKTSEEARKKLKQKINIQSEQKSDLIFITAEDKDPQRAADIANSFVDELRKLSKKLAVTEAAQRRLFFEEQLKETKEALINAEEAVKGFQEKTGVLHVEEQVKAVIKNIAQLRAEIAAKEVDIKVLKTYAKPSNPDLQKAETTLRGMKEELSKLEFKSGTSKNPMMPVGRMPSVGTEYIRKLRDIRFNEALYELFLKQYELAKLDEARDATVIQVIDKAIVPEKKIKPNILNMVVISSIVSFFVSVFTAYFLEHRKYLFNKINDINNLVR
jgi:uncharacterized protein involved in exopolysaccharide biosynthesis